MIRSASVVCLVAAMLLWVGPSAAFDSATYSRAASASMVADISAYNAPELPTCNVGIVTGGTCTFYVNNKATTTQTYTLTRQTNPSNIVTSFNVDSTGGATGTAKSVGQRSTVTVAISAASCTPTCGTKIVDWMIVGSNPNVLDWREEHVQLTVVFNL